MNIYIFCLLSDGPVPIPNMPNQTMNRMQVPQGMLLLSAVQGNTLVLKFVNGLTLVF